MTDRLIVDLWCWSLAMPAAEIERLSGVLSDDERARAARFLAAVDGASFVAARGRLREILGGYVGGAAERLHFSYGWAGKPTLSGLADAPHFNLSHAGGWAALAVCRQHPVGVDIEYVRPLTQDIAQRFFAPAETAAIAAHAPADQLAAFYRGWTRKEAFVKALGQGFGFPFRSFEVSVTADAAPAVLRIVGQSAAEVACWRLAQFEPAPGFVGAVAVRGVAANGALVVRLCGRDGAGV